MKIRRVVVGHNKEGKSGVKWDSEIETQPRRQGLEQAVLWATDSLPVQLTDEDPADWNFGISLDNGSFFRIVRYDTNVGKNWHCTETIDYGIVLSGELWLQLEEEEVFLKAGDVVVQRGTIHSWQNRGKEPCVVAFILIAKENRSIE